MNKASLMVNSFNNRGFFITAVGYTTSTSRIRQHLNAFTVAHGGVPQPAPARIRPRLTALIFHRSRVRGKRNGDTKTGTSIQKLRLMSSITVDTANRLVLTLQRLYTLPISHNSRPVADQLSLSIVHTHRCTGGEIATRSFKGSLSHPFLGRI